MSLQAAHAQPPPRSTHQLALRGKRDVSEADGELLVFNICGSHSAAHYAAHTWPVPPAVHVFQVEEPSFRTVLLSPILFCPHSRCAALNSHNAFLTNYCTFCCACCADLHLPDGSPKARNGHTAPTRISHVAPAPAQPPLTHTRPAAPAPAQPPPAHTTYVAPVQSPPSLAPSSPQGSRASSFTATGSGSAYVFPPRVNQSDQGLSTHLCLENSTISNTANTNTSIRVSRTLGQSGWNSFQVISLSLSLPPAFNMLQTVCEPHALSPATFAPLLCKYELPRL